MSYIPSSKLSKIKGVDKKKKKEIAFRLMNLFVSQLIDYGVIHGDPHEGNIGYNIKYDKFVFYDLGNIIEINEDFKINIKNLFFEIMTENVDASIKLIKQNKYFEVRDENQLRMYIKKYMEYIKTIDIKVFTSDLNNIDKKTLNAIPVKVNSVVFRIVRAFSLIEGICKDLDPEFSYSDIMKQYSQSYSQDIEFIDYKAKTDFKYLLSIFIEMLEKNT